MDKQRPTRMSPNPIRLFTLTLSLLLVSACGGGGGGGSNNVGPQPPPQPAANVAPTANFTINTTSGTAPLVVTVDANGSSDSDGQIVRYTWDFGGTTAIGAVAQFTFVDPGTFVVTLTVEDDDGASTQSTSTVTVQEPAANVTVSGTVQILSSSAVDGDLHDRLTTPSPNNNFAQAQPVPAPTTIGGYANRPGTGENTGNLFLTGDPGDFYVVNLVGGETILLDIAESNADLDLTLYDNSQTVVDASLGTTNTESLEVDDPGTYFIEVVPVSGASNYVLSIGQLGQATTLDRKPSRLSDPLIPGEIIVQRAAKSVGIAQKTRSTQAPLREPTAEVAEAIAADFAPQLMPVDHQIYASSTANRLMTEQQKQRWHTLYALKTMQDDAALEYAEPNLLRQTFLTPNDDFYGSQWHYPAINLPTAWETTTGSSDVIVAVVDTGVLLNHPDLNDKLVPGYDFIRNASRALDGDGIDANPDDPGDRDLGGSSSFHGTHVAGTVGAESNNGSGVSGVAWETRIMPMRALGEGGGSTFDIIQAVRFAAGLDNDSGTVPAQRADIINLSLGGSFSSLSEQQAYSDAIAAGVIIIASAGNESSELPSYPAAYDGVISVSATTISNTLAAYSNRGGTIDVAAPGGSNVTDLNGDGIGDGVISTMGDDSGPSIEFGYASLSGTSMAAPHVAGVAALMKAVHPGLTPAQFDAALMAGDLTDDLGAPGRDNSFGWGLINAQKAVIAAGALANGQGADPGPILVSSAGTMNFGGFIEALELTLSNIGTGSIAVSNFSADQPWVNITDPGTTDGLGTYTIGIDRSGLADGAYQSNLTIESDANNLSVTIIMQVSSVNASADAGLHYIILVDGNGESVLPAVLVDAVNGEYPFTINNVPPGEYRLFAGSDYDDDSFLCDAGEACGAYPTLESPEFVAINADQLGLNFESGFRINLNINRQSTNTQSASGQQTIRLIKPPSNRSAETE
ncbi:MAG: S8 family serine peptidase [Pseudomonadota bacterium]